MQRIEEPVGHSARQVGRFQQRHLKIDKKGLNTSMVNTPNKAGH
jgi:hypothetical protein